MGRVLEFWGVFFSVIYLRNWVVKGFEFDEIFRKNGTDVSFLESVSILESVYGMSAAALPSNAVMVGLTLVHGAAAKGAVCLDGTLPGYHLHHGFGTGVNSWLIQLEGGGWCNSIRSCVYRKKTHRGSSTYFERQLPFTGILSNRAEENPDFFNWNRVKIRYCDGGSFAGDAENKAAGLQLRGQRIWLAVIEDLMSKGMHNAHQALLSGCSAGGLASILHCDEFRNLFPRNTKVKCLSDGGLFMDAVDVSGGRALRNFFAGVVRLQGFRRNLPSSCTNHRDPTSCFFPQNLITNIKTPLFIVNAAYDSWQVQESLAPPTADPHGNWHGCKMNNELCSASQIQFLQGFRYHMLNAVKGFSAYRQNGLFINSCFAHCQSERQDTWFADNSPVIGNKVNQPLVDRPTMKIIRLYALSGSSHDRITMLLESKNNDWNMAFEFLYNFEGPSCIVTISYNTGYKGNSFTAVAIAVGDWYFDRANIKAIDCAYPCDKTCHNLVFR